MAMTGIVGSHTPHESPKRKSQRETHPLSPTGCDLTIREGTVPSQSFLAKPLPSPSRPPASMDLGSIPG